MPIDEVELEMTFKGESAEEARAILEEAGAENVRERAGLGMVGIETALIAMLLTERIAILVTRLSRHWRCGVVVVVDATGKKIRTEKNCDLPRGSVLLVHPDGTQVTLQDPPEAKVDGWFKDAFKAISGHA